MFGSQMIEGRELGLRAEDAARFQIQEALVETPFERSFRAYDLKLDRDVVIKLPGSESWEGWSVTVRDRLLREARVLAKVQSEQVTRVFDVLESSVGPALVVEPTLGEPLAARLEAGPLSVVETRRIGIEICKALASLHFAGVVYRALGPASVLVTAEGHVRLADFTFAKNFDHKPGVSSLNHGPKAEATFKTLLPPYPAPELEQGRKAEPRSDVFACGCLLYRCLAGVDPFDSPGDAAPRKELRALRQDVPNELAEVLRKCMSFSPSARYSTAQSLAEALEACPTEVQMSRRGWMAAAVAGGALVATGGVWYATSGKGQPAAVKYKSEYSQRYALMIGVGETENDTWVKLRNAKTDTSKIDELLHRLDGPWTVEQIMSPNATKETLIQKFNDVASKAGNDPDAALLIFFAGHGLPAENGMPPAVIPYDAPAIGSQGKRERFLLPDNFYPLLNCNAKHVLFVFDSCYASCMQAILKDFEVARPRGLSPEGPQKPSGIEKYVTQKWRGVLSSADKGQEALDGTTQSPFCQAIVNALDPKGGLFREEKGMMPMKSLFSALDRSLRLNSQSPTLLVKPEGGVGDFVFESKQ